MTSLISQTLFSLNIQKAGVLKKHHEMFRVKDTVRVKKLFY